MTTSVDNALRALADPRRRGIVTLIREAELSASQIASHFPVTRPAISQHLRALKDAGLVLERRDGTRRLYRIRKEGFKEVCAFVQLFCGEEDKAPGG